MREILAYEGENLPRVRKASLPDNSWVSILARWPLLCANIWPRQPGLGERLTWHMAGRADAGLILAGQWWRSVTALFLHADAGHPLANAVALAVLASILGRRTLGLTWGLFVLSGKSGQRRERLGPGPRPLERGRIDGRLRPDRNPGGGSGPGRTRHEGADSPAGPGLRVQLAGTLGAGEGAG